MFRDWFLENYITQEIKPEMKVFISYAKEDQKTAKRLYDDLKLADIIPWMESENFIPGQNMKLAAREAIKESSYFLVLLSAHSVSNRGIIHKEIRIALDVLDELPNSEVFVIPVRLDDCKIVDETLEDLYPVDLFLSYKTGFKHIMRALGTSDKTASVTAKPEKEPSLISISSPDKLVEQSDKKPLNENINCFSWLHFTDLHLGMKDQEWLWPGVREILFEDLEKLHDKCGPWDLVLFTGDLTQRGSAEEFRNVDEILDELWEHFDKLGSAPKLLAVPGNHDLVRPDAKNPSVRVLQKWDSEQGIHAEFWSNAKSPYRKVIDKAFENYTSWWESQPLKAGNINKGTLPGDFSVTIEKNGSKLGILGMNITFLQLTGDDYTEKLVLHPRQFHEPCNYDGPKWAKQHHACLFLTHQPPAWLHPDYRKHLNAEITARGRFAVHLCGHLHETLYRDISEGGSDPRRIWQGHSLFGLEHFGNNEIRLHGYTAGKIELCGDNGNLVFWPRKTTMQGREELYVFRAIFRSFPGDRRKRNPYNHGTEKS